MRVFTLLYSLSVTTISVMSALMFAQFWKDEFAAMNFVILAIYGAATAAAYTVATIFQGQIYSSEKKRNIGAFIASIVHIVMSMVVLVWLTIRLTGLDQNTWDWASGLMWWQLVPFAMLSIISLEWVFGVAGPFRFLYGQKLQREMKKEDPLNDLFIKMELWANQVDQNETKHE